MTKKILVWFFTVLFFQGANHAALSKTLDPEIEAFICEMADKHDFDALELRALFRQVKTQSEIIKAIAAPATARPWHEYRARTINDQRIRNGVKFWDEHAQTLARAREQYGVPEEIIVATLGVETRYGKSTGKYRVLDALTTLAFDYPSRAEFFKSELEEYLLFTRDRHINPLHLKGSYAGAMGMPQFIPSSYRDYAVDFDGDGKSNLWTSAADAIGSIANYYQTYGWQPEQDIALPAILAEDAPRSVLAQGVKPHTSIAELQKTGVIPRAAVADETLAAVFSLEEEDGEQVWLALNNFYVITRYNRSVNYAMAVYELSQELRVARDMRTFPR
ncbi:MAG: lytic murein transglycosylase B [Burkholderiales bacterium]